MSIQKELIHFSIRENIYDIKDYKSHLKNNAIYKNLFKVKAAS